MRLKLYRAPALAEAIARVRAELGGEALILSTRRVADGVEVTAALDNDQDNASPALDPRRLEGFRHHGVTATMARKLERGPLAFALSAALRFGSLPLGAGASPLLLVGPPGGGKTLTAARLATRLVMGGAAPVVITADGKRAGATEQLAAFTRLLGVPLLAASHPVTLARALARREAGAPVIIDAPGLDPFDANQADELAALSGTAAATMVVVLPAGLDTAEAADLAQAFAALSATFMIATRLDVARRLGGVLAAAERGLILAEAGVGPGAADGLAPLTPELLASRLMRIPAIPERAA